MFVKVVVDWKKMDEASRNVFRKALLEMRFRDLFGNDAEVLDGKLAKLEELAVSYNDEAFDEMFGTYLEECLRLVQDPHGTEVERI